ncbi:MAG: flagellar hook-basal body protein [Candidatus Eisenbacteria bacterium]|uniref:Flagellar hook-basal body protein n=1 Tax=Eiseniibacteriota bacterium TaxID=2212470 RepID=A0A956M1I5_UNCEI|nr:flagellar hook-basal body protein [Candidatus Eisenbacteria bacterium]
MIRGMWVSASALGPAQRAEEILANNLANVSTPGFRQVRFAFQQAAGAAGLPTLPGGAPAPGQAPGLTTQLDLSEASLETTGNPLDLSVVGSGFFAVQGPGGPLYTRDASLVRGLDGTLLHRSGYPILTESGPVVVPDGGTFDVGPDGTVKVDGETFGRLQVVELPDPTNLRLAGRNLIQTDAPVVAIESPQVVQGASEGANADPVETMVEMMAVLRAFQANQSAILTQDSSLGQLIRWASS